MFGSTLEDTMDMQKTKFPDRKLPWILTCLTEQVIQQQGTSTEGIFRYVKQVISGGKLPPEPQLVVQHRMGLVRRKGKGVHVSCGSSFTLLSISFNLSC